MQRYFIKEKENNKFCLSKEDSYHIVTVMRMQIGDLVEVVFLEKVYVTKIIELKPNVIVEIIEELSTYNELEVKVTICQSLVKENKMDLVLQKGVELGASSFIPLKVKNSLIKINDKEAIKKRERWTKIVKEASEQSKRNKIPIVENVMSLNELVKLPYDVKILCTVNELTTSFKNILQKNKKCGTMIIVVGPEGGFTKDEEMFLIQNGYISVSLGKFVLRTETAALCALSMINYEYER